MWAACMNELIVQFGWIRYLDFAFEFYAHTCKTNGAYNNGMDPHQEYTLRTGSNVSRERIKEKQVKLYNSLCYAEDNKMYSILHKFDTIQIIPNGKVSTIITKGINFLILKNTWNKNRHLYICCIIFSETYNTKLIK